MTRPDYRAVPPPYSFRRPLPGREALLLAALLIGLLMLGMQLWLLTVALELYLAGEGDHVWGLAIVSGGVFLGGLLTVWRLSTHTRVSR